jgi:hypothetical protein
MYKISEEKSVTFTPTIEEIEAFIFSKPKYFKNEIKDGKIREGTILGIKGGEPWTIKSNFGRDSEGRLINYSSVWVYFRKCWGCNCLFSTEDERQYYHSKNCQIQSYYYRYAPLLTDRDDRTCAYCGKSLRRKNKNAKTCSNACRMALSRQERKKIA